MNPKLRIGNATTTDRLRNRPMIVTVRERCDHCGELKEGVERREHKSYWPSWAVNMKSCLMCFEAAKRLAAAEASGAVVC